MLLYVGSEGEELLQTTDKSNQFYYSVKVSSCVLIQSVKCATQEENGSYLGTYF